jgi:coenzyme Q-binding protein COQ10
VRHHVSKILPYTPEQLFRLVGDVARYPEFVPWLTSMRTWNERHVCDGVDAVDAEAGVGFSFLKEKFASRVRRDVHNHQIDVSLISGPFRKLENRWRFLDAGHGCTRIEFDIDFVFKSRILETLLRANFGLAVDRLIACFEGRAKVLYGQASESIPLTAEPAPAR